MLLTRILTALVLIPLILAGLFWLPQSGWTLLVCAIALAAAYEWAKLADYGTGGTAMYLLITGLVLWLALFYQSADEYWHGLPVYLIAAAFWFVIAPLWMARGFQTRHTMLMALTGWCVIVPTALAMIFLPRPYELLWLMATVWIADTAAYLIGRKMGKRKLAPSISPGKTWEGAIAALVAALIYAEGLQAAGFSFHALASLAAGAQHAMTTGLFVLLACLGIVGDLFESWMKRTAGVKDSGKLLPGHGGVLDRIDALTSTLPIAALALGLLQRLH
jgi:phosphatidate cytidylyltransferase